MDTSGHTRLPRGLRVKFLVFVNALFVVAGTLLAVTLIIGFKRSVEEELRKRGLAIATNIAANTLVAISQNDSSRLIPMLAGIARQSDIAYAIVLDRAGKVIAHTSPHDIGTTLQDPLTRQALAVREPAVFPYRKDGQAFYDVVAPALPALNTDSLSFDENAPKTVETVGVVRLGLSLAESGKQVRRYALVALSVLGGLVCAGTLVSFVFVRRITSPLVRLTDIAAQMARGDFSQTVDVASNDEMAILAAAFSRMSASLKAVIGQIQAIAGRISTVGAGVLENARRIGDGAVEQAAAAEETASSTEEMNAAIKQIAENADGLSATVEATSSSLVEMSAAIGQMASGCATLSSAVEDTAAAVFEMSRSTKQLVQHVDALSASAGETASSISEVKASVAEVGGLAKESARLSEEVSRSATELGTVAVGRTIEGMQRIQGSVSRSSQIIHELGEQAERIGKILTIIDEVNDQTNLLALNAAILAAQAGESGRGFAVVADEIKSLADRTAASTKEIVQLIGEVQTKARDAVTSIKEGSDSVEEGVRLSTGARETLGQILERSRRSSEMSRQIERATHEQVRAATQMAGLMQQVSEMVDRIKAVIREHDKGIAGIAEASEKIREIARQVKTSTEEQAKGSTLISTAMEDVTARVQQIAEAINEQKRGTAVIAASMAEIRDVTQRSVDAATSMSRAVEGLMAEAGRLSEEVGRFRI